jgi:PAS domain S-box-containing protein
MVKDGGETNYYSFFQSSPDLLFVFDNEGAIIEVNTTATEKLQYKPQELLGKSIYSLHPPEQREAAGIYLNEILESKRDFCPIPLITKSGDLLYVETKISRGIWNGESAIFSLSKDLTEKRLAEESAKKNEERYRILFENINDAVFVHELTAQGLPGRFMEVNRIACDRLGYSREELLAMSPENIDAPESYALVPAAIEKLLVDGHIVWEGIHVSKSGVRIPVEISNHLFSLEGKSVVLATVRDINDRKKGEDLLKRSEEKYRKIFENVQDIFYQADVSGRIVEISPSIERYSGYKPEELIGMKVEDVYLNPAGRAELLKVLGEKEEVEDYILKLKTKLGKEVFVSANIHILTGENGEALGVEGSLRDVTERIVAEERLKENEKLLRKQNEEYAALNRELRWRNDQILMINKELQQASDIFMNIRTGLHIYHLEDLNDDRTLRMIGTNPAAERLTGLQARDLLGNTLDENFPGLRAKGIPEAYAEVIRTRTARQFDELIYGDDRVVEGAFTFNAFPLPDDCVGISFENVTEQYKARELIIENNRKLKEAKDKAEESDRLKSSFLANMSHEIRTPMNGIMGFSMMLADPQLPKETRDSYTKIVNSSCDQLLHIVNDIIDISKIEAGQIDINESSFDIKILLNELYAFYSSAAQEKGVSLEIDHKRCNLNSASWIVSDRTKLRQIFDNLFANAVKFTPSGKIMLRCELLNGFIMFEVEDTGIGIEPELQNVIFERFRQIESNYTKTYGGTGLGLSITKAYIEKLGGNISVRSEFGKGSVFSFKLPYKPASDINIQKEQVSKFRPLDLGMTIMVVEDEEINWLYLNEILKNRVKVLRAVNGKEAVELVNLNPDIDIILMDIKLPDINGLELTKIIKSMNGNVKVIAQTAYALSGDRESVIAAGCSGYISKPVNRDELLNLIIAYSHK